MTTKESKHLYFMSIDQLMSLLLQAHEEKLERKNLGKLSEVLQPKTYIKR